MGKEDPGDQEYYGEGYANLGSENYFSSEERVCRISEGETAENV